MPTRGRGRMMGAGLPGSSNYNVNVNKNTGGGNKKQGGATSNISTLTSRAMKQNEYFKPRKKLGFLYESIRRCW